MEKSPRHQTLGAVDTITKTDKNFEIVYKSGETAILSILNSHVFRYYMAPSGDFKEYPTPNNVTDTAKINSKQVGDYNIEEHKLSILKENSDFFTIDTHEIEIHFNKKRGTMSVFDRRTEKKVFKEIKPISYDKQESKQTLRQHIDEYFFGGGMQNGRFTHKGYVIEILNTGFDDGGVTSPCPFYWSTYGYGVLRNTWQPGVYDFGLNQSDTVETKHYCDDFDAFFFINEKPRDILKDYYELTGSPILMPEYAFYEAHLNSFNVDYWVKVTAETNGAILFEDGEYYQSYQPSQIGDKKGILESLNGENNNYQFSARAMIDRYRKHDIPLGWFIPNDDYDSGYGQTDSLDGDINNLREFVDYAHKNGVEVGLLSASALEPSDPSNPKKGERDLGKEVSVAGIAAIKFNIYGYSNGLSTVEKSVTKFTETSDRKDRPVILTINGWAGTQRFAGIRSGDQSGGEWENIRFHIPTFIGTGLSGQPLVASDMDGMYGGENREVNVRDYQWKTFTPIQLNMDGWGKNHKTPFSFDTEITDINRAFLKLKSMLMPYNYTVGYESTRGLPMIRAMFLEYPNEELAYTKDAQYQYMWGPTILVAPVYENTKSISGESIRRGIYLPDSDQVWIDLFTGKRFQGGKIYENTQVPIRRIPTFIKNGAIIPLVNPNNNLNEIKRNRRVFRLYPHKDSNFVVYEDDGITIDYLESIHATTRIKTTAPDPSGYVHINLEKTKGYYRDMHKMRTTVLEVKVSQNIDSVSVIINGKPFKAHQVENLEQLEQEEIAYSYTEHFYTNTYFKKFNDNNLKQKFVVIKIKEVDVTITDIDVKIKGYTNKEPIFGYIDTVDDTLNAPFGFIVDEKMTTHNSISLQWQASQNTDFYEIELNNHIHTNVTDETFTFLDLRCDTEYSLRIRSVHSSKASKWSYYILVKTAQHPDNNFVKCVSVNCNIPCQPGQEICNLINGQKLWHTDWSRPNEADVKTGKIIKLYFDLGEIYKIAEIKYKPREDAGNGTILSLKYKYSVDAENWIDSTAPISWNNDNSIKVIQLDPPLQFRYFEIHILESVGGFGSGKYIKFLKAAK